jgi:hypothetical protein
MPTSQRRYSSLAQYMDAIPTLGCIVNLRSAAARFLRHCHTLHFSSCIKPHVSLTFGQVPPSRNEFLRIIACSGLNSKLLDRLFFPAISAGTSCSSFASSVLRRVTAKLAAATPEMEAATVVTWCKQAAADELPLHEHESDYPWTTIPRARRPTEYAADAMSQLAASTNGRLALVSCGACETLVDTMLQHSHCSVEGCQERSSYCARGKGCECLEHSCYAHRCYLRATLLLAGCAAGAFKLIRSEWDPNWDVVGRGWDDGINELARQTAFVNLVKTHGLHRWHCDMMCECGSYGSTCRVLHAAFPDEAHTAHDTASTLRCPL